MHPGLHNDLDPPTHHVQLWGAPLARPMWHVLRACSQHGNVVPYLTHGFEFHVRADTMDVLKGDVEPSLELMRHNARQQSPTARNLPITIHMHGKLCFLLLLGQAKVKQGDFGEPGAPSNKVHRCVPMCSTLA